MKTGRLDIGLVIDGSDHFILPIEKYLEQDHNIQRFKPNFVRLPFIGRRVNNYLLENQLKSLLDTKDVVFFEWSSHLLEAATHLTKRYRIITRLHRFEMYRWADSINWGAVDKIILVSQAKQREFIEKFPNQAHKTEVIYVAVNLNKFQFIPKPFTGEIGILCNLSPRKRVYELILVFYELLRANNDLRLHIAGGRQSAHDDYYAAINHIVNKLGLESQVIFYGHVNDTWNWYRKVDIFVSNSYSEGLQVAPMEAMATGSFCLAHRWDGADELLPDENLYVTNKELMTKVLEYYDLQEADKQKLRRKMRSIAEEKFNLVNSLRQIRKVIEDTSRMESAD